jgi:hypothetical protein
MNLAWEMRNAYFISENLTGRGHLRNIDVDKRLILK